MQRDCISAHWPDNRIHMGNEQICTEHALHNLQIYAADKHVCLHKQYVYCTCVCVLMYACMYVCMYVCENATIHVYV